PDERPNRFASCGLSARELPHTCFVSGFGHSCSHALLAKLPSHRLGSGRSKIVIAALGVTTAETFGSFGGPGVMGGAALAAMTPSCSACLHHSSKPPWAFGRHVSRTRS